MTDTYLYPDFLKNEEEYIASQNQWNTLIRRIAKVQDNEVVQYLDMMYNGKPARDGNPIVALKISKLRLGVRIMQFDPEEEGYGISAWLDTAGDYERTIRELVIDTKFTLENYATAAILIKEWFAGELDEEKLNVWLPQELVEEAD